MDGVCWVFSRGACIDRRLLSFTSRVLLAYTSRMCCTIRSIATARAHDKISAWPAIGCGKIPAPANSYLNYQRLAG
jgi:hypothetical protein